jgi:carbonic anhydrase
MPFKLLEGIRHFKNNQLKEIEKELPSLSKGQTPDVIFITCSDSRLSPHLFTHSGLGVLFVGRNPGNIVPPLPRLDSPSGTASTIEYGLMNLNVKEIIVCGHSHCGAMKGLLTPNLKRDLPHTAAWLSHSRLLVEHLEDRHPDLCKNPDSKLMHLTKDNVLLQIEHLKTHPAVQKRLAEGNVTIHGWYYEIDTAEVHIYNPQKKAFISFEQTVEELVTEELTALVEKHALAYLSAFKNPKNHEEYQAFRKLFNEVRFTGVCTIWKQIEPKVKEELFQKIGKLYVTDIGGVNPLFNEMLKKGPAIRLSNLQSIEKAIELSPWLNKGSIQNLSQGLHRPEGEKKEAIISKCTPFIQSRL